MRRKLPQVMRAMVAIATVSVNSSLPLVMPSVCQRWVRIAVSSSVVSGRYSWAKPMRLYSWG